MADPPLKLFEEEAKQNFIADSLLTPHIERFFSEYLPPIGWQVSSSPIQLRKSLKANSVALKGAIKSLSCKLRLRYFKGHFRRGLKLVFGLKSFNHPGEILKKHSNISVGARYFCSATCFEKFLVQGLERLLYIQPQVAVNRGQAM